MTLEEDDALPPKPRQLNRAALDDQEMRTLLAEAARPMGRWQQEAVHLRALQGHHGARPSEARDARVATLTSEVRQARQEIDAIVLALPDRLRSHGRVRDFVEAFGRLELVLAELHQPEPMPR